MNELSYNIYLAACHHIIQVARHLKITHEDSPYFRVVCQRPAGSKVAPGMEANYLVIFTPDEKKVQSPAVHMCSQYRL